MPEVPGLSLEPRVSVTLPQWDDIVGTLVDHRKPTVSDRLLEAGRTGRALLQPRCGVGDHRAMSHLLQGLEATAGPELLTLTIDSYTRLKHFQTAAEILGRDPGELNGYPLVAHGWRRGRELDTAVTAPLQVRHGSPDGRELFAVTLAAGITSFEGGGLSYNLPYCKNVPLSVSLEAWRQVDSVCGLLAEEGVDIDREMFGSLTGVLMPPALSLAVCLLEAYAAAAEGVRCVSIAYPQGGQLHQDVAALRVIRSAADRYLPGTVAVHPVLHTFMGVFPRNRHIADALILYSGFTARIGGAHKVVTKSNQEAYGIPDVESNGTGISTTRLAFAPFFDFVEIDEVLVAEESYWLEREVAELIEPVLEHAGQGCGSLAVAIEKAFSDGRLDVPFAASVHARSEVIPSRDSTGAIRYRHTGQLPFSKATRLRNRQCLAESAGFDSDRLVESISADINYFLSFAPSGADTGELG